MNESLKMIIALFHEISSTLGVCREDLLVMIEQHQRNALLEDRIQESLRRINRVVESMPHMTDLLNAISEEPEAELPEVEASVVQDEEAEAEPEPEPEGEGPTEVETEVRDVLLSTASSEEQLEPPPEGEVG